MSQVLNRIDPAGIAGAFVAARREVRTLDAFPGPVPPDLATAYLVQEAALAQQPRTVAGWKIAAIRPEYRDRYTAERLVGPILAGSIQEVADGATVEAGVFPGGFAAVEAEFAFRMGRGLPARQGPYTLDDVVGAVGSLHIAMEIASSPLASLSDLGPGAVIGDHGNNAGLIVGPEIPDWSLRSLEAMKARMTIDGRLAGEGSASNVPGGPSAALFFLVDHLMTRGRSLEAGDYVSTGATTGVHKVSVGTKVHASFGTLGSLTAAIVAMGLSGRPGGSGS